jgi:hypothetical protein
MRDGDCNGSGEVRDPNDPADTRCATGFACAMPFVVGPLACRKLCVCKDYVPPTGLGIPTPIACQGQGPGGAQPGSSVVGVEETTDAYVSLAPVRQLDLVTMVDNSTTMAPKIAKLNTAFPRLIEALKDPADGTLPDLRVAIIDSDLGTGGAYASGPCGPKTLPDGTMSQLGDLGRFQMLAQPAACTFNAGATFLEYWSGQPLNYAGDISTVFSCLTGNLGTAGCGEEHQLQAFEFALAARGVGNEEQQATFLRPSAQLGLIFLTDEDDCSAAPNDGMFGDKQELRGETASLRCATRGHQCAGWALASSPPGYPTDSSFLARFQDCAARTDTCPNATDGADHSTDTSMPTDCSPLKNIAHLAVEMKSLKADPENQILVAGVFGWPRSDADMAAATYKIAPVPNPNTADTQHPTVFDYWPVCYDPDHLPAVATTDPATGFDATAAAWGATGGLRESAFVDHFGANGMKLSICEPDFSNAMASIGSALARKLQNLCFDAKLLDVDPATPGIQADCRVVYLSPTVTADMVTYLESPKPLPQCPPGVSPGAVDTDCWQLNLDPAQCPASGHRRLATSDRYQAQAAVPDLPARGRGRRRRRGVRVLARNTLAGTPVRA